MGNHLKHTPLTKPDLGQFGRNEIAILGTTCENIKKLAYRIIESLKGKQNIAYVDADHKNADKTDRKRLSEAMISGARLDFTDKITYFQINKVRNENPFQLKKSFIDQDLILVNGNHFTADKQILVIDPIKNLQKKIDRITDVTMILLTEQGVQIPEFLKEHIDDFESVPVYNYDETEKIADHIKKIIKRKVTDIKGLVLAGGKSERMKQDKGLIDYHGKPQRDHTAELLTDFCKEVFISVRPDQVVSIGEKFKPLADTFTGLGPFGGIISAFREDPNSAWMAVACDLPYLDKKTLSYLVENRNPSKIATSFWDTDHKFPEPLITIWEPKAYPELLHFLSLGYSCPRKTLINSEIELLEAPDKHALTNVNYPEEMEAVFEAVKDNG